MIKTIDNNDILNAEIKEYIKISFFENHYTYGGQINFDDFGDKLFLNIPKSNVIHHSYVMNSLNGKTTAEKINATFPVIVYIDIDFKHKHQEDAFNSDKRFSNSDLLNKFKTDKNIWISGNSRNGKGIRLFFIVYNKWAVENKTEDYHTIHVENSNIILKYLEHTYGLKYYGDIKKDYIDRAPLKNMVLKTFPCLLNEYSNVNNDCNIIVHDKEIITPVIEYDKNVDKLSYNDIDYIPIENFVHYDPRTLAVVKFSDEKSRLLFYDKYCRYYEGTGIDLKTFESFCKYLDKSSLKYSIDFKDDLSKLIDLINNPYEPDEDIEEDNIDTPYIDENIFSKLPNLLQDMLKYIPAGRSKDIFLTSELCVLSSIFHTATFDYWYEPMRVNLNSLIVADAASCKSISKQAINTLKEIQNELNIINAAEISDWDARKTKNPKLKEPKPRKKFFVIPVNVSEAQLYSILELNDGVGLMFETEAAEILKSFGKEWGDYKTILLKNFQNEPLRSSRMSYDILIELPKIGVVLTGTKKVLFEIIPSSEDGFFSRFIYYMFNEKTTYENPIKGKNNITNVFSTKYAEITKKIYFFFKESSPTITFSDEISDYITDFFKKIEIRLKTIHTSDIDSVIKRYSIMCYKILSILTLIRYYEKQDFTNSLFDIDIKCDLFIDSNINDAEITLSLIDTYIKHTELVFVNLAKKDNIVIKGNKSEIIYNYILNSGGVLNMKEINEKAKELDISNVLVLKMLKKLISDNKIIKIKRGIYKIL